MCLYLLKRLHFFGSRFYKTVVFIGRLTAFYVVLVPMEHIPTLLTLKVGLVPMETSFQPLSLVCVSVITH